MSISRHRELVPCWVKFCSKQDTEAFTRNTQMDHKWKPPSMALSSNVELDMKSMIHSTNVLKPDALGHTTGKLSQKKVAKNNKNGISNQAHKLCETTMSKAHLIFASGIPEPIRNKSLT